MSGISELGKALAAKRRVYQALTLRFVVTRYGRENIGFLWVFVEPMLLCLGVMGLWSIMKGKTEHGIQLTAIVFTGYMPLTLWRHITGQMIWAPRIGKNLAIFRGMTMLDFILAKVLLEIVSVSGSVVIVYFVLNTFGVLPDFYDMGLMLAGWGMMSALGLGFGLTIACLAEFNDLTEKVIQPIQYFLLPLSGCFFMLDWLPDHARDMVSYVPLVHAYETFRAGFFGPNVMTYGDLFYGYASALVLTGLGFFLFERIRDRVNP
ncbi:ABC transporter permease [Bosea sp. TAF32]|uniref:ABC transporter permease n=1 Tax=Bosea sp. TAF32 TaxID=3237482 RepID=UPI003F939B76